MSLWEASHVNFGGRLTVYQGVHSSDTFLCTLRPPSTISNDAIDGGIGFPTLSKFPHDKQGDSCRILPAACLNNVSAVLIASRDNTYCSTKLTDLSVYPQTIILGLILIAQDHILARVSALPFLDLSHPFCSEHVG